MLDDPPVADHCVGAKYRSRFDYTTVADDHGGVDFHFGEVYGDLRSHVAPGKALICERHVDLSVEHVLIHQKVVPLVTDVKPRAVVSHGQIGQSLGSCT